VHLRQGVPPHPQQSGVLFQALPRRPPALIGSHGLYGEIVEHRSFVYSPDRFMPAKLRSFLDFALPRLKTRLGDLPKGVRPTARGKRGHKA